VANATTSSWLNLALAAEALRVVGSTVAFLVPEAGQGGADLNGDGDASDLVLRVYDAESGTLVNLGRATEDFVLGDDLIAFRTDESAQGDGDLNGDGDTGDAVLQVYDLASGTLANSEQAAVACRLEVCDPRIPYRVAGRTVTYLTIEAQQGGADLNGDGDAADLVLQVFSADVAAATSPAEASTPLAGASTGVCSDTGAGCASDSNCGPGATCFVPPGACILDLGAPCAVGEDCGTGQFCREQTWHGRVSGAGRVRGRRPGGAAGRGADRRGRAERSERRAGLREHGGLRRDARRLPDRQRLSGRHLRA
jgi:hypothetical protein